MLPRRACCFSCARRSVSCVGRRSLFLLPQRGALLALNVRVPVWQCRARTGMGGGHQQEEAGEEEEKEAAEEEEEGKQETTL